MRSKSKSQNLCATCSGTLTETTITHEERRGTQPYLFQNVPAQVREACGEIWIDELVLQAIEQLIENGEPVRQQLIPVFDLALTH